MGLTMQEKRALTRETCQRYRKACKKDKTKILDEYTAITGYNRKYALHVLANWRYRPKRLLKRRRPLGIVLYNDKVILSLTKIWTFFDYMCGKRLSVFIQEQISQLEPYKDFGITPEIKAKLLQISPATIDRRLKLERRKLQIKGISHTKSGKLLKQHIPIRTFYTWDERKPGFFELDTVAHDGGRASGDFCYTLNATDVYSGWVELRALRNKAHHWVYSEVTNFPAVLPFPLKGIDSDNGGEFINKGLLNWCYKNHIQFTRSRSYHKNDNCFVEQKNDMTIRQQVGYYRFDSKRELAALAEVYKFLCPLLNFCYPSVRLTAKTRVGARVNKVYDQPKTPYKRLLESPDIDDTVKAELRKRAEALQPVQQKLLLNRAKNKLMCIYEQKLANSVH